MTENGLKNTLADILLEEFHNTRSLPHPSECLFLLIPICIISLIFTAFTITFSLKGAKDAYWTLATRIEQLNKHFTKLAADFCTAFHSDEQLFDHFEKLTGGTEKTKLDDAFRNLKNIMNALPLEKASEKGE